MQNTRERIIAFLHRCIPRDRDRCGFRLGTLNLLFRGGLLLFRCALVFVAFFHCACCLSFGSLRFMQLLHRGLLLVFQLGDMTFERIDGLGIAYTLRLAIRVFFLEPFVSRLFSFQTPLCLQGTRERIIAFLHRCIPRDRDRCGFRLGTLNLLFRGGLLLFRCALVFVAFFHCACCLSFGSLRFMQLLHRGLLLVFQLGDMTFERIDGLGIAYTLRLAIRVFFLEPFVSRLFSFQTPLCLQGTRERIIAFLHRCIPRDRDRCGFRLGTFSLLFCGNLFLECDDVLLLGIISFYRLNFFFFHGFTKCKLVMVYMVAEASLLASDPTRSRRITRRLQRRDPRLNFIRMRVK